MRTLILVIAVLTLFNTYAQSDVSIKPYFVAVIVEDIEVSKDWYVNNLGFKVSNQMKLENRGIYQANLVRDGALLELIQINSAISKEEFPKPEEGKVYYQGLFKIGFLVEGFDEFIDSLKEKNVEFHGDVVMDERLNTRMVIVKDPDNNYVQLFEMND